MQLVTWSDATLAEVDPDIGRHPCPFSEPQGQRFAKRLQSSWREPKVCGQDSPEFQPWLLIEDNEIQSVDLTLLQAIGNCMSRETWIMFSAGEPFFLSSRNKITIYDKAGRRVVIVAADPKNIHCRR